MPSLAYTEIYQTKYPVLSMFAFGCIIWTLLHVFRCTYSGWLISDNNIIGNENGHNSDLQEREYFGITSITLNDVNVRGGNAINHLHEKSVPVKGLYRYSR